jgi:hypothetical protein
MNDSVAGGHAYTGDTPQVSKDLMMSIAEYLQPGPVIELSVAELNPSVSHGAELDPDTFTVRNSGSDTLTYTITDNVAWLNVVPDAGSSDGEEDVISVEYDVSGLDPGTYNGTITVTSPEGLNSPQTIAVTLEITPHPGDLDFDRDVDQEDFGLFQVCLTGPELGPPPDGCTLADIDRDADVDEDDLEMFQVCGSGPSVISDPNCIGVPPEVIAAVSRRTHGGAGTFDIALFPPGDTKAVECRSSGPNQVIVTLDQNVEPGDGSLDIGDEVNMVINGDLRNDLISSVQLVGANLTVSLGGVADQSCVTLTIAGLTSIAELTPVNPMTEVQFLVLVGDVNGTGTVDGDDTNALPDSLPAAATVDNFRGDVDANGTITILGDAAIIQSNYGNSISCPGYPQPLIELSTHALNPIAGQGSNPPAGGFTVRNSAEATLDYTITDDMSWLEVAPESGASTGEADLITATYDVAALPADTYTGTITVSDPAAPNSPQTIAVTLTITPYPQILAAVSRKTHGGAGTFDINVLAPGAVECRSSGATQVVVTFDADIVAPDGTLNAGDEVNVAVGGSPNNGLITGLSIVGADLTVDLSGVPDETCLTITLSGIAWAHDPGGIIAETDIEFANLVGDVTGDAVVSNADLNVFPGSLPAPAGPDTFRFDVDVNGTITVLGDRAIVQAKIGNAASCP